MKCLTLLLFFFLATENAAGQGVKIDSVSLLKVCAAETFTIFYSSFGTFDPGNFFQFEISDTKGSFNGGNGGESNISSGAFKISISNPGIHRLRITSTKPRVVSDTSPEIHIFPIPHPSPITTSSTTPLGTFALTNDSVIFFDADSETLGSSFLWRFNQDYYIVGFNNSRPVVTYPTGGLKTGTLAVANSNGCTRSSSFQITILSCNPRISPSAHIVTGSESGGYDSVLVKAGGDYTADGNIYIHAFIESGATLNLGTQSKGIYYIKNGATVNFGQRSTASILVCENGLHLQGDTSNVYTFYCPDLRFDYSQLDVKSVDENPIEIESTLNHLHVRSPGEITVTIYDLLGIERLSKKEYEILDIDLSSFSEGIYFAKILSNSHREVRKIIVVH